MAVQHAVFKSVQEDERLVYAEVYAPNRPDSDGEFMDAEGIRQMAFDFMKSKALDSIDSQHDNELVPGCCVVESFIARKGDQQFIEGSWVVGMHVDNDDMWQKIKEGEINGFSMEALTYKEEVDITMEIPPVIQGLTLKSDAAGDDHTHTFYASYDEEGNFRGGRTDTQSGHFHVIKRGTVTEPADGHTHRFSHLEGIELTEVE